MGELVDRDVEHLRLLTWGYYIMAGITGLFSLLGLLYTALGAAFVSGVFQSSSGNGDPRIAGIIMLGFGSFFTLVGLATATAIFLTGRFLRDRRHRVFCMVVAVLCCLQIPWGTVIGGCTLVVLNRESVRALFERPSTPPYAPPAF
jgi:hypothetical protein